MPDMLPMPAAQKSYPVAVFVHFKFGYQAVHLAKSLNSSVVIGLSDLLNGLKAIDRRPEGDFRFAPLTFVASTKPGTNQPRTTAQLTADYCRVYVSVVGVSPNLEFMFMVLPPSPNWIVVDWLLPATFGGAVKVSERLFPVSRQVPEPFTELPENVAVNVPFGLNSITSLPLHEVAEPPGNGIVAGHFAD
jgi:hypothetical protein